MSVVTLQIGQCGNQLGKCFLDTLAKELCSPGYDSQDWDVFFRHARSPSCCGQIARAVLIDTEPKAVHAALSGHRLCPNWSYSPRCAFTQQSGSGNNWALGFNGQGNIVQEAAMDIVRREVEQCDVLGGLLTLQSMAGGTGAGLGARIAETLRDEFPFASILNHCVWPHSSGEVVVQNYNALLTVSHLLEHANGVAIVENEVLHQACQQLYELRRPAFAHMNAVATKSLVCALLPSRTRSPSGKAAQAGCLPGSGVSRRYAIGAANPAGDTGWPGACRMPGQAGERRQTFRLHDWLEHLCAHPRYQLISLCSIPHVPARSMDYTTFTWQALLKRLKHMAATGAPLEGVHGWGDAADNRMGTSSNPTTVRNRSVANLLILRGKASGTADSSAFSDPSLYVGWNPEPLRVCSSTVRYAGCEMSAAMLSNSQRCVVPIRRAQGRAWEMFKSRAFLHHYERHGLEAADFRAVFARIEELLENYRLLC